MIRVKLVLLLSTVLFFYESGGDNSQYESGGDLGPYFTYITKNKSGGD
jgi:hypothetical protein